MSHDPIAYTYDADTHCPGCAAQYVGGADALDSNEAEDSEGNSIGAIFPWSEWWNAGTDTCETMTCGTCREEIVEAHAYPHSPECPEYEEAFQVHDNGVVEVLDAVEYLRGIGVEVREGMYGDVYVIPVGADTVQECGTCGRMWDNAVSTASTPAPSGRCPFEYDHEED